MRERSYKGIGIFNDSGRGSKEDMDADPGVKVGFLLYRFIPVRSFPELDLPK